jgi:hypothetical protein
MNSGAKRRSAAPRCASPWPSRFAAAVLAALLWSAAGAAAVSAHGGYPTRLGVRDDPDLALLARVVMVYLVDGQGMNVHLTVFDAGVDPGEEYAAGKFDLFVDMPSGGVTGAEFGEEEERAWLDASYPGAWVGPFRFRIDGSPGYGPLLIAHSRVAADLRFTLLRDTLEKLLEKITVTDLERLRTEGGASPRDAAAAARRLLKAKGLL